MRFFSDGFKLLLRLSENRLLQRLMENVHPADPSAGRNPEE